jgi:uncharacterized protein with beta-barrel porin domain
MIIESGVPIAGKVENDGTMLVTANGSNAIANGVIVLGDEFQGPIATFQGSIVNKGKLIVSAVAPAGHAAHATAIAMGFSSSTSAPGDLPGGTVANNGKLWVGHTTSPANPGQHSVALVNGTIINDGGTLVAEQTIGGVTTRGTAITVLGAPNPINILLKGTNADGHIYGDIEVRNGDTVTVSNGKTLFDGIVNDPADKVSALSISAGGTLEFVNNLSEGPAHAYVNTFLQAGTLGIEVNPTPVAVAPTATTTAGFVSANSATLSGALLLTTAPGIYADHTTYQVVFSATPIVGTWSSVGTASNSALLKPQAVYTANEADVTLTRVAFDDVPGLTPNEEDVADGIESSYGGSDNGPFNTLAGDLVTLDQADYKKALDLLGDADDGELDLFTIQGVEKFLDTLGVHITNLGAGGSASNEGPARVKPAQLIPVQFGSGEVWGSIYGSWSNLDSTISGPKASGSQNGMAVGLDAPIDKNTIVGAALNYSAGTLKIDGGRAHGSYSGFSGALYGRYDDDRLPWYATATGSFGGYADRSRRFVSIPGPAGGSGIYSSRFFSRVWSLYGEAGYEVARDDNFTVTPYAALEVLQGTTGAYASSETTILSGSPLPTLLVSSTTATSVDSRIGAAIATQFTLGQQTVLPSLRIAWLHEFNDNPWIVNAAFAGVPTSGFRITGAGLTSNFLDLDAGITMKLEDSLDALIDYEGRISSDRQDHALVGRLVVKL